VIRESTRDAVLACLVQLKGLIETTLATASINDSYAPSPASSSTQ